MIRYDRRVRMFAVSLAALAGYVDAMAFIELGGFFVSFMSGNSTRLGVGLAGSLQHAALAGGLIAAFVLGAISGFLIGQYGGRRRQASILMLVASLLLLAAAAASFGQVAAAVTALSLAMGAENAIFEQDGEVRIGLTYMTGTLVKMAQRLAAALRGGDRLAWIPYFLLWGGLVAGAAAGAAVYAWIGLTGLWISAAAAMVLALAGWRLSGEQPA